MHGEKSYKITGENDEDQMATDGSKTQTEGRITCTTTTKKSTIEKGYNRIRNPDVQVLNLMMENVQRDIGNSSSEIR